MGRVRRDWKGKEREESCIWFLQDFLITVGGGLYNLTCVISNIDNLRTPINIPSPPPAPDYF
jgi:hypothetical protein